MNYEEQESSDRHSGGAGSDRCRAADLAALEDERPGVFVFFNYFLEHFYPS